MSQSVPPRPRSGSPHPHRDQDKPSSLFIGRGEHWEERIQRLLRKMQDGIERNRPVDLSTPPHSEITEALRRIVYAPGDPARFPVIYGDNTQGQPFPVRTLWLPEGRLPWKPDRAVHVGTLTFRHVDYDDHVDVYLIRDRETRTMTNAEIEARAYERMAEILSDPQLAGESYVAVFHTGLEPLVVGLYRALVDHLKRRRAEALGQLVVQPVLRLHEGRWITGRPWA